MWKFSVVGKEKATTTTTTARETKVIKMHEANGGSKKMADSNVGGLVPTCLLDCLRRG